MVQRKTLDEQIMDVTPLGSFLGEERMDTLKDRIANLIVERIERDLESYDQYLFWPDDYEQTIKDAFGSAEKKIKKMYENVALEVAQRAVERFKTQALNKPE